ncbi:red-sensitive opsin [Platysternon megacephalum]|uniref:Red-sensitive opsin n=1 Tax=Platysternon megacephalum TaxID=55544 RepID=A0A4D9DLS9_9SAUR|nr:red-sensitive opsin [Platysternon megacephalum]
MGEPTWSLQCGRGEPGGSVHGSGPGREAKDPACGLTAGVKPGPCCAYTAKKGRVQGNGDAGFLADVSICHTWVGWSLPPGAVSRPSPAAAAPGDEGAAGPHSPGGAKSWALPCPPV